MDCHTLIPNKMKTLIILVLAVALSACSPKYSSNESWVAAGEVTVLDDIEGQNAFVLNAGETCTPARDALGKVDKYTQVRCTKGVGWVRSESPFNKNK
jgi:hypothetical protein